MVQVLQFRKAERKKAKLRLGIAGPSGSGKTKSSLLISTGLGEKIAMIDSENGSGDLYADEFIYDIIQITSPFTPEKYITGIKAAEEAGYGTIIIDSLSHAWAGEGGLLDLQGKIVDSGRGNSYTAWRAITPKHNALVESMLQSKCHIIATMRSKMAYAMQENNGKTEVKKVGLEPVQRDGMEYEFTLFLDINHAHIATASKDRTGLFDTLYFKPTIETGKILKGWLESGTDGKEHPEDTKTTEGIDEITRLNTIKKAMALAASEKELEKICDAYRSDYEKLSNKGKEIIKREKTTLKAKLRATKVA